MKRNLLWLAALIAIGGLMGACNSSNKKADQNAPPVQCMSKGKVQKKV